MLKPSWKWKAEAETVDNLSSLIHRYMVNATEIHQKRPGSCPNRFRSLASMMPGEECRSVVSNSVKMMEAEGRKLRLIQRHSTRIDEYMGGICCREKNKLERDM